MRRSFLIKNITKAVIFLWVISFCFLLQGKPIRPDGIFINEKSSLSDLSSYALLHNPGLKAAFDQWKALLENVTRARSLPNPKLTFAYFIQEVETRVGPQKNKVGIMQMFPWFGTLKLKGKAALEAANSHRQKVEQMKFNLLFKLKKTYYQYYYIFQNISILEKNVKLLEYLEKVVETKYKAGSTGYVDLIKIQIEKDKLLDQIRSAREQIVPLQNKLNSLLNRDPNASLPPPQSPRLTSYSFSKNQLREWLKKNNPELKSLNFIRKEAKAKIKLARKGYFPNFALGLNYIFVDEARMTGVEDSGKDPIVAMVQFSLPIWFSKNRARVNQAKWQLKKVVNQKKDLENNLLARLGMVFFRLQDGEKKIKLYGNNLLPQARQAVEVIQSAYKTGNADILNFIDSQRTLLDFELKHEYFISTHAQRKAELEMLVGKTLF